jgi:hypothetical protein
MLPRSLLVTYPINEVGLEHTVHVFVCMCLCVSLCLCLHPPVCACQYRWISMRRCKSFTCFCPFFLTIWHYMNLKLC